MSKEAALFKSLGPAARSAISTPLGSALSAATITEALGSRLGIAVPTGDAAGASPLDALVDAGQALVNGVLPF